MKTMDEILEGWLIRDPISEQGALGAMREVEQQTREEMFEFAEWFQSTNEFMRATTYSPMYYRYDLLIGGFAIKEIHITELFDYWKSLNK